jgi:hypothetical protein
MMALPPPPEDDDIGVIAKLCRQDTWQGYEEAWLKAYASYRQHGGDPWQVAPTDFGPGIHALQYALYDGRGQSTPLKALRTTDVVHCPMCGSPGTGSLDHFLPRTTFPEFSIFRANLVPACAPCNSASKGQLYRRDPGERFIHPYFDAFADMPLWAIDVVGPYEAARFFPRPLAALPAPIRTIVAFHLEHVLGGQFTRSIGRTWSRYPHTLQRNLGDRGVIGIDEVRWQVGRDLGNLIDMAGTNAWGVALLRGVLDDPGAIAHLAKEANKPLLSASIAAGAAG